MNFKKMIKVVPEGKQGIAEIRHYTISEFDALRSTMHGIPTRPESVAILDINGRVAMSDSFHERMTNKEFISAAKGSVLIAGLGIGMIVHPLLDKPEVTDVTIVELELDVISLIKPTLPDTSKIKLVQANIFNWHPAKGTKYDTIYFDIWPDITEENVKEMIDLRKRFRHYLKKGGWMRCWCESECRSMKQVIKNWEEWR